jgi:ribosomal protein S18 acetylase RimI-like enzyme
LAQIADLEKLGAIEIEAAKLFPPERIPHPHHSLPLEVLQTAQKQALLFVAEKENRLAGFASCHRYQNNLHLDEISVLPEFGRQGIGKQLLEKVIEAGKEHQCEACTLTTFEDIPWNAPFYLEFGFEILDSKNIPHTVELMLWEEKSLGLVHRVAMKKLLF